MIASFTKWIRSKIRGKPYDPTTDPVWRSLHDAKIEGQRRAEETHTERRVNKLESVYLHRRIQPQNGQGGPHE
jgi:hypothetical protein